MEDCEYRPFVWNWLCGDKLKYRIFLETAVAGLVVAGGMAIVRETDASGFAFFVVMGALAGAVAGLVLSGWFGRPGYAGWCCAFLASLMAPSLGGAVAGSLIFPGAGTIAGLLLVPHVIVLHPVTSALWAICFVSIHLHVLSMRERTDVSPSRGR